MNSSEMMGCEGYFQVPNRETTFRHPEFDRFVQIISDLRSPDGCPWDLRQTHLSISKNMLEEAFEAVAAIEEGDIDHLREELGDVLMQVVLQSQIAQDNGEFTIEDVAHDVSEKLIRRHPHVYGPKAAFAALGLDSKRVAEFGLTCFANDSSVSDSIEGSLSEPGSCPVSPQRLDASKVGDLWDLIKKIERQQKDKIRAEKRAAAGFDPMAPQGLLEEVSPAQPALLEAHDISRKVVSQGFEWPTVDDVWGKVYEEIEEYKAAPKGSEEAELEFGDILFSLVNVARKDHLNAEISLRRACAKFRKRWEAMEAIAYSCSRSIGEYDADELKGLWEKAKDSVG